MRLIILLALAIILTHSNSALSNTRSKIALLLLSERSQMMYIYPQGGVSNPPACHGSNGDYISYKMDRPMAKEYFSALLSAFALQNTVSLITTGTCEDQPYSETLLYFWLVPDHLQQDSAEFSSEVGVVADLPSLDIDAK